MVKLNCICKGIHYKLIRVSRNAADRRLQSSYSLLQLQWRQLRLQPATLLNIHGLINFIIKSVTLRKVA